MTRIELEALCRAIVEFESMGSDDLERTIDEILDRGTVDSAVIRLIGQIWNYQDDYLDADSDELTPLQWVALAAQNKSVPVDAKHPRSLTLLRYIHPYLYASDRHRTHRWHDPTGSKHSVFLNPKNGAIMNHPESSAFDLATPFDKARDWPDWNLAATVSLQDFTPYDKFLVSYEKQYYDRQYIFEAFKGANVMKTQTILSTYQPILLQSLEGDREAIIMPCRV